MNEKEDDGLGAIRGCLNAILIMVFLGLIIGYVWYGWRSMS